MSLLVKLTVATLVIPVAAAIALGTLAFTATTPWEAIRMAMWSGICTFTALTGGGLAYSFHQADQSQVRETKRDDQVTRQRQAHERQLHDLQQQVTNLRRELAIHTAFEAFHEAAGMPTACVIPIDKNLRVLPEPREDQDRGAASERN